MARWLEFARLVPLVGALAVFAGCESQGPAEQVGENLDNAAQDVGDALDPAGPAEEAGEAIDETLNP
ncbi:hypothetical protein [Tautonia sociabilis]|uniref:hypothetical protein n=1 Tax=Tautonia sociabilis TaxID=2080755 RepID=UPI001F257365|nr:hypothetical protein [Tautonia sociabilis]